MNIALVDINVKYKILCAGISCLDNILKESNFVFELRFQMLNLYEIISTAYSFEVKFYSTFSPIVLFYY